MAIHGTFTDGTTFIINFKRIEAEVTKGRNQGKKKQGYTCTITRDGTNQSWQGSSVRSFQDKPNSKEGRKVAIERAISMLPPTEGNRVRAAFFSSLTSPKGERRRLMGKLVKARNDLAKEPLPSTVTAVLALLDKALIALGGARREGEKLVYGTTLRKGGGAVAQADGAGV